MYNRGLPCVQPLSEYLCAQLCVENFCFALIEGFPKPVMKDWAHETSLSIAQKVFMPMIVVIERCVFVK